MISRRRVRGREESSPNAPPTPPARRQARSKSGPIATPPTPVPITAVAEASGLLAPLSFPDHPQRRFDVPVARPAGAVRRPRRGVGPGSRRRGAPVRPEARRQQDDAPARPRRQQSRRVEGGRHRARAGPRPALRLCLRLRQLRHPDLRHQQPGARRRRSSSGRSRIPSCTAASAPWTASTSRSATKYYYAQSFQFMQGSPDADLGAVIFDVTGLPDSSKVKVVARIRYPAVAGRLPQHVRLQALRRPRAATSPRSTSRRRSSTISARS